MLICDHFFFSCFFQQQVINISKTVAASQIQIQADHPAVHAIKTSVKQTIAGVKAPSDQPRILYQCGDCDELFKSLDLWQLHRKEESCQQSAPGSKSKPDSQPEPETSTAQAPTSPLNPDDFSPFKDSTIKILNAEPGEKSVAVEEEQQVTEAALAESSDPPASEAQASTSNPEYSSPKRRGANKKPKPEPVLLCVDCGSCFGLVSELVAHRKTQHGFEEALHHCSVCGESFLNTTLFLYHRKQHRQKGEEKLEIVVPVEISEEVCSQTNGTDEVTQPSSATVTFTQPELFMCTECGESFSEESGLLTHRKAKHGLQEPVHTCSQCGVGFMNTTQYLYHRRQHRITSGTEVADGATTSEDTAQDAPQSSKRRLSLSASTAESGSPLQKRSRPSFRVKTIALILIIVVVQVCQKSFTNSHSLLRHSMSHTGTKPFSCDVCGKNFSQAATLKRHQRIHSAALPRRKRGRKPVQLTSDFLKYYRTLTKSKNRTRFRCQICHKEFAYNSTFNVHMRTHTDERPFEVRSSYHERIHSGLRPFCCWICGKSFSVAARLTEHARTHSGEKPYPCPHCPAAFRSRSNLDKHIRLHGDLPPETTEQAVHEAEAAHVQKVLEGAKVLSSLAATGEIDSGAVQTIYVLQGAEGGTETVMIPSDQITGMEGTSQVVILPSSVLGTQAITVPTITMDGNEITMVEAGQSPQHAIEFIVEETRDEQLIKVLSRFQNPNHRGCSFFF
uniref:Zinc finger protein 574 n=1 Tax=Sphaeramia orbicularis TaxID=375764 RepID=A0A673CGN2_9TELE